MAKLVYGASGMVVNTSTIDKISGVTPLSIQYIKDLTGKIICAGSLIDLDGATDIYEHLLEYKYMNNEVIGGEIDFSSLKTLSQGYALQETFKNCPYITSIRFDNLLKICGTEYTCKSTFEDCVALETVNFDNLFEISGYTQCEDMFKGCTSLESVSFPSLRKLQNNFTGTFANCTSLKHLYFPKLDATQFKMEEWESSVYVFNGMLTGVTGCTIHLPTDFQMDVGLLNGYPNFGGTNTVVLLDQNIKVNVNVNADTGTILYNANGTALTTQSTIYPVQIALCPNDKISGITSDGKHVFLYNVPDDIESGDTIDLTISNLDFSEYTFYTAAREQGDEISFGIKATSEYVDTVIESTISTADTLCVYGDMKIEIPDCMNNGYMIAGIVIKPFTPDQQFTLTTYTLDIANKRTYDISNFATVIQPSIDQDTKWNIDTENNRLVIGDPEGWMGYESSKCITLDNITSNVHNVLVAVRGYVSADDWDPWAYGYVALGTEAIEPTHDEIEKRQIPSGSGEYVFVQRGNENVMQTNMYLMFNIDQNYNKLSLGYTTQGMGWEADNCFYIESIEVIPMSELSN